MKQIRLMPTVLAVALLAGATMSAAFAAQQVEPQAAPTAVVPDRTITSAAQVALHADAPSAGLPVKVVTKQGIVMLSGTVPSAAAGDRVVRVVASVAGVKEIRNDLKVQVAG